MNQRDRHKYIAQGVAHRKDSTQKELADLLVEYSERMEKDSFSWNKRIHRLVGRYRVLVEISNIGKEYPDEVPDVKQ